MLNGLGDNRLGQVRLGYVLAACVNKKIYVYKSG